MKQAASKNLPFYSCVVKRVFFGLTLVLSNARLRLADCIRSFLQCKSNAPRRTVINNQILTKMTHISLFAAMNSFENDFNNEFNDYQVEVVTFDGDVEIVSVEAHNEQEAADKAAAIIGNADYTMVY